MAVGFLAGCCPHGRCPYPHEDLTLRVQRHGGLPWSLPHAHCCWCCWCPHGSCPAHPWWHQMTCASCVLVEERHGGDGGDGEGHGCWCCRPLLLPPLLMHEPLLLPSGQPSIAVLLSPEVGRWGDLHAHGQYHCKPCCHCMLQPMPVWIECPTAHAHLLSIMMHHFAWLVAGCCW